MPPEAEAAPAPAPEGSIAGGAAAAPVPEHVAPSTPGEAFYPEGGNDPAGKREGAAGVPGDAAVDPAAAPPPVEAKPEGDKPTAEAAKPEGEAQAPLTITLPEAIAPDPERLTAATATLTELGLDQAGVDKLLPIVTDLLTEQRARDQKALADNFTATTAEWQKQTLALPEFSGPQREQSLAVLGRVMDEFGNDEVRAALNTTGLGNHPGFVKMILDMANTLVEGTPTTQGRPAAPGPQGRPGPRSRGELFYPNSTQQ